MYTYIFFNKVGFLDFEAHNFQLEGTRNNHPVHDRSCSFLPQLRYSLGHVPFLGYSLRNKKDTTPLSNHSSKTEKNWVNHLIGTLVAKKERGRKKKTSQINEFRTAIF